MIEDRERVSPSDAVFECGLRVQEAEAWSRIFRCRSLLNARVLNVDAKVSSSPVAGSNDYGGREYTVVSPVYDARLVQLCDDLVAVNAVRNDFDYLEWAGHRRYPCGAGLASAPVADAVRMATRVVRSEKFADGAIGEAAVDGTLVEVVHRLCSWYEEMAGAPDGDVSAGHSCRSPIELLCWAAQLPQTFLQEIEEHATLLLSALNHLRSGDRDGYLALMTPEASGANLARWAHLGKARARAAKESAVGLVAAHPILTKVRSEKAETTSWGSIPTAVKESVMARDGGRCVYCDVPLVMPDDWGLLRRFDPCVLPKAVLIDGVAKSADGGALSEVQRAPIIGYRHQLEHLVPRSRGGTNTVDNVVSACGWCNRAKRTHTLSELGLPTPQF